MTSCLFSCTGFVSSSTTGELVHNECHVNFMTQKPPPQTQKLRENPCESAASACRERPYFCFHRSLPCVPRLICHRSHLRNAAHSSVGEFAGHAHPYQQTIATWMKRGGFLPQMMATFASIMLNMTALILYSNCLSFD